MTSKSKAKDQKVEVSFTNWILGGSLLSVSSTESDRSRRRIFSKNVVVTDVSSGDNEIRATKSESGKSERRKQEDKDDGVKGKDGGSDCKRLEEKKSEESKNGEGGDNRGWSAEQDSAIKSMKRENKSWKEIAIAVGSSKKDCQNRFKELSKAGEEGQKSGGGGDGERGREWEMEEGFGDGLDFSGLFDDFSEAWKITDDGNEGERNKRRKADSGGAEKNKEKGRNKGEWRGRNEEKDQCQTHQQQGRLQADNVWSRDDCKVLEMLEARYTEHKWLHIQAGFFNWTGRMILGELIEQKFRDDGAA